MFRFDVGSFVKNVSSNRGNVGSIFFKKIFKNNRLYKLNQLNRLNQHLITYLIKSFFEEKEKMSRPILSLNKSKNIVNNSSETKPIKNMQAKTQQEAPQQPKKKNKADVNAKKKQHRIDRIAQHWALFSEPEAKPLMIGIKEAMIAEVKDKVLDIPESHIKQGLRSYISRKAYLKALTLGGNRFDMNGQPNGEITPEQQAIAEKKLVEWIKNSKVTTARA